MQDVLLVRVSGMLDVSKQRGLFFPCGGQANYNVKNLADLGPEWLPNNSTTRMQRCNPKQTAISVSVPLVSGVYCTSSNSRLYVMLCTRGRPGGVCKFIPWIVFNFEYSHPQMLAWRGKSCVSQASSAYICKVSKNAFICPRVPSITFCLHWRK